MAVTVYSDVHNAWNGASHREPTNKTKSMGLLTGSSYGISSHFSSGNQMAEMNGFALHHRSAIGSVIHGSVPSSLLFVLYASDILSAFRSDGLSLFNNGIKIIYLL